MKEKSIILPDWMADAAAKGRLTQISEPLKPQPEHAVHMTRTGDRWFRWLEDQKYLDVENIPHWTCPYRVGTVLVGKETWGLTRDFDQGRALVRYRADDGDEWRDCSGARLFPIPVPFRWRAPATMPRWAARHRWTVTAVSVRRAGNLTRDDMRAHGVEHEFLHQEFVRLWQSRYGARYPWPDAWVWVLKVEKV